MLMYLFSWILIRFLTEKLFYMFVFAVFLPQLTFLFYAASLYIEDACHYMSGIYKNVDNGLILCH